MDNRILTKASLIGLVRRRQCDGSRKRGEEFLGPGNGRRSRDGGEELFVSATPLFKAHPQRTVQIARQTIDAPGVGEQSVGVDGGDPPHG